MKQNSPEQSYNQTKQSKTKQQQINFLVLNCITKEMLVNKINETPRSNHPVCAFVRLTVTNTTRKVSFLAISQAWMKTCSSFFILRAP